MPRRGVVGSRREKERKILTAGAYLVFTTCGWMMEKRHEVQ
jgi:hypothetical protein